MQTDSLAADVIIVGCGPCGATLSLLLAECGISSLVLEREPSIYPLPRAVHFDDHIMRVFQTLGIADSLEQVVRYNPGMRFVDPDGSLLLDWPRPAGVGENGWHTSYRFHQPDLENILRTQMRSSPAIELKPGVQVTAVEQYTELATVHCGDGKKYNAKYIVGCDGAKSVVRSFIGEETEDYGFNERWLVVDVLLNKDKPELGDFTIQHCGRERPSTYVRCPANRRRWEISLKPDDCVENVTSESAIWNFIGEWLTADEAIIERSAVYEFKSLVAKTWRDRRLFIAGDAAHLTPPFMGQGMCAGIRDVSNLAWKLAACCDMNMQHTTQETVLNSYQSERIPNVTEYIDTAIKLGALINSCGNELDLKKAFTRDDGTVELKSIVPKLGSGLQFYATTEMHPRTGSWCTQPMLKDGTRLDDLIGYQPVLIANPAILDNRTQKQSLENIAVISSKNEPELQTVLNNYCTQAILIRPDRYILGVADCQTQLDQLTDNATQIFAKKDLSKISVS